jgi:hypothetical protein
MNKHSHWVTIGGRSKIVRSGNLSVNHWKKGGGNDSSQGKKHDSSVVDLEKDTPGTGNRAGRTRGTKPLSKMWSMRLQYLYCKRLWKVWSPTRRWHLPSGMKGDAETIETNEDLPWGRKKQAQSWLDQCTFKSKRNWVQAGGGWAQGKGSCTQCTSNVQRI